MNSIPVAEITTKSLSTYLVTLLKLYGVVYWRQHSQSILYKGGRGRNPAAGLPDFIGVTKNGRAWAGEIKGPSDKISPLQKRWIDDLRASNAIVEILDSYSAILDFIGKIKQN